MLLNYNGCPHAAASWFEVLELQKDSVSVCMPLGYKGPLHLFCQRIKLTTPPHVQRYIPAYTDSSSSTLSLHADQTHLRYNIIALLY